LDELAVENALRGHYRPKLERYGTTLLMVCKTVKYVKTESIASTREIVESGEVMAFVGPDFVVTVRHGEHSGLAEVRKRLEDNQAALRVGPFAVMHALAEHVVDSGLYVADHIATDIDAIEEHTFSPRTRTDMETMYLLKREVAELRRAVGPLTVALQPLVTDHPDLVSAEVRRYISDVLDRNISASHRITTIDDVLSWLVEAALGKITMEQNTVSMQQNTDMRKISAWVAIAAVPTAVAGIYGMNFEFMPELKWMYGYPVVVGVILITCLLLYRTFRRNKWL
jgi:magnesium transporter